MSSISPSSPSSFPTACKYPQVSFFRKAISIFPSPPELLSSTTIHLAERIVYTSPPQLPVPSQPFALFHRCPALHSSGHLKATSHFLNHPNKNPPPRPRFIWPHLCHMEVPGPGINLCHGISQSHCSDHTRSLTH